jgi:hypothetical protein
MRKKVIDRESLGCCGVGTSVVELEYLVFSKNGLMKAQLSQVNEPKNTGRGYGFANAGNPKAVLWSELFLTYSVGKAKSAIVDHLAIVGESHREARCLMTIQKLLRELFCARRNLERLSVEHRA